MKYRAIEEFEYGRDFQNGYAAVQNNMTSMFIDKNGNKLEID